VFRSASAFREDIGIDEHSRACLGLKVARRINSVGVIEALADAM
jgi:hypothetical protein